MLGGGCIARATQIDAENGVFFLKWGEGEVGRTFRAEALGLQALAKAGSPLKIPRVLDVSGTYLLLEWIEQGNRPAKFWEDFGRGLAILHQHEAKAYGFESDNFIGRTPQYNTWASNWVDFFRDMRLAPQVQLARANGLWRTEWNVLLDRLCKRLDEVLPAHPARSILHGDLWSGNFMISLSGQPVLIDPAVCYGHNEADLAMTELFGGFDRRFYAAYKEVTPVEGGYIDCREVYNLYHLINHLNLFGGSYAGGVERVLRRFG